jgi:hypothetical protein
MKFTPNISRMENMARPRPGERIYLTSLGIDPDVQSISLEVLIADGPWQTIHTQRQPKSGPGITGVGTGKFGDISLSQIVETRTGQSLLFVSTEFAEQPWRVVGIDSNGKELIPTGNDRVGGDRMSSGVFTFNQPPAQLRSISIQARSYSKRVRAKNISINPAKPMQPQIVVDDGQK